MHSIVAEPSRVFHFGGTAGRFVRSLPITAQSPETALANLDNKRLTRKGGNRMSVFHSLVGAHAFTGEFGALCFLWALVEVINRSEASLARARIAAVLGVIALFGMLVLVEKPLCDALRTRSETRHPERTYTVGSQLSDGDKRAYRALHSYCGLMCNHCSVSCTK